MKKLFFSALFGIGLLGGTQAFSQDIGTDGDPVISGNPDHSAFIAYLGTNNVVEMRWGRSVNDEIDHYVVEHSTDGSFFNPLHQVVARNGAVRDSGFYYDADAFPTSPVNYYRLTTFLKDGSSFSSKPVKVTLDPGRTPALVPSALHEGETLRMDQNYRNKLIVVEFFSPSGQFMAAYEVNGSSFNVNTTGWQKGLYFYRITSEGRPLVDSGKILIL
ncbi:MAG TPA: hypothetical protein VL978_17975 [Puia sp.]|nr:hypothetical protein [Puia sp.]